MSLLKKWIPHEKDRKLFAVLFPVLIVLLSSVIIGAIFAIKAPRINDETLCVEGQELNDHTVIIIDRTSNFTSTQRSDIRQAVADELAELGYQEKLSLFSIDAELRSLPSPQDSVCRPAKSAAEAQGTSTDVFVQTEFKQTFVARMDELVNELTQNLRSDKSPILEYLRALTSRKTLEFTKDVPNRRLVLISDLAQHMPGKFSSCNPTPDFSEFLKTDYAGRLAPDLEGVEVTIYHVERSNGCAGTRQKEPSHQRFWLDYFEYYGADVFPPGQFIEIRTGN